MLVSRISVLSMEGGGSSTRAPSPGGDGIFIETVVANCAVHREQNVV